jgi:hypothetical protein
MGEWLEFGIDAATLADLDQMVGCFARSMSFDEDVRADISQAMWLAGLEIRRDDPSYPLPKLREAMRNAARDCAGRLIHDAPYVGRSKDTSRMTTHEE